MEERGLSNSDFRTLMMTPAVSSSRRTQPNSLPETEDLGSKDKKKKFKKHKKRETAEYKYESSYRDRAKERRDVENDEDNPDVSLNFAPPDLRVDKEATRKAIIEKSKFLGGDMEHTHLVKGLDFALLNRVKVEISVEEKHAKIEPEKTEEIVVNNDDLEKIVFKKPEIAKEVLYKTIPEHKPEVEPKKKGKKEFHFETDLARNIHYALFGRTIPKTTEKFLNGRTAYMFDIDPNSEKQLPTMLIRSKDDCVPSTDQELVCDDLDPEIMDKIDSIMSYLRGGPSKPKRERKKKEEEHKKPEVKEEIKKPIIEEDPIFPEAGNSYVPKPQQEKGPNIEKKNVYFPNSKIPSLEDMIPTPIAIPEGLKKAIEQEKKERMEKGLPDLEDEDDVNEMDMDVGEDAYPNTDAQFEGVEEPEHITLKALAKNEKDAALAKESAVESKKRKDKEGREKDPTFVSDNYAECYPGTYESSFLAYEGSDDEKDDISKMDMGKKNKLKRWDFASEEAWSSYNDNREAMPKAAFQFGVKMGDGRKTKKNQSKDQSKKVDKELKKINEIIKQRENSKTAVPTAQEARKKMKVDTSLSPSAF